MKNKKGDIKALSESFFADAPKQTVPISYKEHTEDGCRIIEESAYCSTSLLKEATRIMRKGLDFTEKYSMSSKVFEKYCKAKEKCYLEALKEELRQAFPVDKPICIREVENCYYHKCTTSYYKVLGVCTYEKTLIKDFSNEFSLLGLKYCRDELILWLTSDDLIGNRFQLAKQIKAALYTPEEIAASPSSVGKTYNGDYYLV